MTITKLDPASESTSLYDFNESIRLRDIEAQSRGWAHCTEESRYYLYFPDYPISKGQSTRQLFDRWLFDTGIYDFCLYRCNCNLDEIKPEKVPLKAYKPHSDERKVKTRCTILYKKLQSRFSIPGLRFEAYQDAALKSPEYYGVCILPSELSCLIYPLDRIREINRQIAIARENELRAKGI